jgi:hypothetical protein
MLIYGLIVVKKMVKKRERRNYLGRKGKERESDEKRKPCD